MNFLSSQARSGCLAVGLFLVVVLPPGQAATTSLWTGGSGDWLDAGSWSAGVPWKVEVYDDPWNNLLSSSMSDATIDNGSTVTLLYSTSWWETQTTTLYEDLDGDGDLDPLPWPVSHTGYNPDYVGQAIVGDANSGFLRVENGARLNAAGLVAGNQAGATGGLTVTGQGDGSYPGSTAGSYFDAGASVIIGNAGHGEVTVEDYGEFWGGNVVLGKQAGATGLVTAANHGVLGFSTLVVGGSGTGTLNLTTSASTFVDDTLIVGQDAGSTGTVSVIGGDPGYPGQLWVNSLVVGDAGDGSLTVENGTSYLSTGGLVTIGKQAGSTGVVEIKTTNGNYLNNWNHDEVVWEASSDVIVGDAGQGRLLIQNGGRLSLGLGAVPKLVIGNQAGSLGEVIVTGGNSYRNLMANILIVGNEGTGTLTVADRASISAGASSAGGGTIELGKMSTGVGTLNIGTGAAPGQISATAIHGGLGQATVNINHNYTPANSAAGLSYNDHYELIPRITGSTTVNHLSGYTMLLGNSSYTGATTISGGRLEVWNAPSLSPTYFAGRIGGTSAVTIGAGAELSLTGDQSVVDRINDAANVTMDGGTIFLNGLSEGTTSSAGLGAFNLLSTSMIDFGNPLTAGILTFAGVGIQIDKSVLQIANWNGIMTLGGGTAQLLFVGNSGDFTSLYDQSEVQFFGYQTGYLAVQGIGIYEIVPFAVPEPSSSMLFLMGGAIFWRLRRRLLASRCCG